MKINVLVLKSAGTNNDMETAQAFKIAGAYPDIVHINKLLRGEKRFNDYKILAIPGGFSYGDDISAGKVLANKLIYALKDKMKEFVEKGRLVIGICNGFQVLVKSGLLPSSPNDVTLTYNDSGKFECRWVYLKIVQSSKFGVRSFWMKNLPEIIQLPVAHGEGKFIAKNRKTLEELKRNGQIIFKYVDETGKEAGYPWNPNGSAENIAGMVNERGNVFGLMPHPERFVTKYQHPLWTRKKDIKPYGLTILRNVVEYAKHNL